MICPACGTAVPPTARFCHKCGANLKVGHAAAGWRAGLPWGIAGAAVGALLTVLVMRAGGEAPPPSGDSVSPPDISQMSPEERASRLFNRVMILAQSGKQDSVRSEEHTSELQSPCNLVCRLLLEKKKLPRE